MPYRDNTHNLGWKLLSLGLATLIWFAIRFGIHQDGGVAGMAQTRDTKDFVRLPIKVLTAASDHRNFKVEPSDVNVRVSGEITQIRELKTSSIEVLVSLVDVRDESRFKKSIQVLAPPGINILRIDPPDVTVERVGSRATPAPPL